MRDGKPTSMIKGSNMSFRSRLLKLGVLIAGVTSAATAAAALSYGSLGGPGFFNGSGVPDGNFWIDTAGGIQVGLRIKDRGLFPNIGQLDGNNPTHTYNVNGGPCTAGAGNTPCGGAPKADWNYEFSVSVGQTDSLTNYIVRLYVDTDPTAAVNFTSVLDVFNNWGDNTYWNGAERQGMSPLLGEYIVQQSANPNFGDSGFGFIPGAGLYDIKLSVFASTDTGLTNALASTTIQAQVPEPSSIALLGAALGGLAYFGRRRKSAASAVRR